MILYVDSKGNIGRRAKPIVGPIFSRFQDGTLIFSMGLTIDQIKGYAPLMPVSEKSAKSYVYLPR